MRTSLTAVLALNPKRFRDLVSRVRSRRLELPRVAPQRPQRCASTNSATTARGEARGVANSGGFVKGGETAPPLRTGLTDVTWTPRAERCDMRARTAIRATAVAL